MCTYARLSLITSNTGGQNSFMTPEWSGKQSESSSEENTLSDPGRPDPEKSYGSYRVDPDFYGAHDSNRHWRIVVFDSFRHGLSGYSPMLGPEDG